MVTAESIIEKLDLKPLPGEGGFYRETYKSKESTYLDNILENTRNPTQRSLSTAIYYLVTPISFSALHKIKSDEIFHFYAGDSVEMIQIDGNGFISQFILGANILAGENPQILVPKNTWQALKLKKGGKWALMGTTVTPGFEFMDFELGDREKMNRLYPHLRDKVQDFTHNDCE